VPNVSDKGRDLDPDEFWDLEPTRPRRKLRRFYHDTGTALLRISDGDAQEPEEGAKIPRRTEGKAKSQPQKPTIEELMRDKLLVRGSDLEPFPETAAERDLSRATQPGLGEGEKSGEPAVNRPPGISPWDNGGEAVPRANTAQGENQPYLTYTPDYNRLIFEVRVSEWPSPYTFYERFRSDARRYLDYPAKECRPAPFFSFMPQYVQLNADQRAWYFYWRSLVREGKFPPTDFGYVMLYIYELINLSDVLSPDEVLSRLCDVWLGYRVQHPRLDRYLSEWVCDLCLIHKLPVPYERLKAIYPQIIAAARFKEFYVGCNDSSDMPFAEALFCFNSGYDWRHSKYMTDENRHLFEEHIRGAFLYACKKLQEEATGNEGPHGLNLLGSALKSYGIRQRAVRDAYSGALCSYEIKRKIEVVYFSCTRSPELRYIVTDMVKYAENNVRAMLGIKSRFGTPNLPESAKKYIAEYFAPLRASRKKKDEEPPEYERYYEADSHGISPEAALELERSSWETTKKLIEAFDEPAAEQINDSAKDLPASVPPESSLAENEKLNGALLSDTRILAGGGQASGEGGSEFDICRQAFAFLRDGDTGGFIALAERLNILPDTLIEKLNEYAYDIIGDIAAEPDEKAGWRLVPDYVFELDEHFGRA